MENMNTAVISTDRYEELLAIETRTKVAIEKIVRCDYISMEDLLFILGTDSSVEKAKQLHNEAEKFKERFKKSDYEPGFSFIQEE